MSQIHEAHPHTQRDVALACAFACILAWFLYFAGGGLGAALSKDDLMNIYGYLQKPLLTHLLDALRFWSTAYRPLGAFFYVPLYSAFGLNPLPYRVACFALLLLNLVLLYRFALRLTGSTETALLATFFGSYHAWFVDLYYSSATIYDLLCYALYLAAFLVYAGIRARGRTPGPRTIAAIAVLFVLALDAKEMAVTFPLMLLLYEVLFHARRRWLTVGITGALALLCTVGKLTGPGSLTRVPSYALTVSPGRFLDTFHLYLNPLLYQERRFHDSNTVQLMSVMLIFAAWRRSRVLLFSWFWLVLTLLPVAFIAHYAAFFEYLPFVGWTLCAATVLVMIRRSLFGERRLSQVVLLLGVAALLAPLHARESRKTLPHYFSGQPPAREILADLALYQPTLPRGGRLLFVDDPLPKDSYFLFFAGRLLYRDMTLTVDHTRITPVPLSEYAGYDAVFRFEGTRLIPLRRSH